MEDEGRFDFDSDVLLGTAEKFLLRDTAIGIYSQADTFMDLFADGAVRIGDSSAGAPTNYVNIAPDGEITLAGTARVKGQILIDNANLGFGLTAPTQTIIGNYGAWEYGLNGGAANDDSVFTFHLPHEYASGTDVTVQIDWYIDEAGGDEIKWAIAWSATPHDSTEAIDAPTHTGSSDTGDIVVPATAKYFTANTLTIGGASLAAGDQVGVTLSRADITDGVDPANDPGIVDIHVEFTKDKLGEAT
jgi:hypothetical protein